MLSIPLKFSLGGRSWKVKFVPTVGKSKSTYGRTNFNSATIEIKEGMDAELTYHTFYHELLHAISDTLGWKELNEDEERIDAVAGILLQFFKSKRGNLMRTASSTSDKSASQD